MNFERVATDCSHPYADRPPLRSEERSCHIPNHATARLSALDMRMVTSIPPGGNWKNIPADVPSKRLEQIRESFRRGEGSRSTYYGRLRADQPAYTINTYFSRPGNGCHIHYLQDRVVSQREAARLQSFPDAFEFLGSHSAVSTQIGNAVPPMLAYQIACSLGGSAGVFVDLFSGAGGMGLGFKWAGWKPIVANDIQATYLRTYARNVHPSVIAGSISDPSVFSELVTIAKKARRSGRPFWVLGGPPCQGFSTAGNQRSMGDPRNHLAWDYVRFLEETEPDGFVFENVTGLLNMQGGAVFAAVRKAFSQVVSTLHAAVLSAADYGVPQRRNRVILVGHKNSAWTWVPPEAITSSTPSDLLPPLPYTVTVEEALSDLPSLYPGQDGSNLSYRTPPQTIYQAFMRGLISPTEYRNRIRAHVRGWQQS